MSDPRIAPMTQPAISLTLLTVASALLLGAGCSVSDDVPKAPVADGACSDGTGDRFADCGNGTVTDTTTGLIWLKNASCFQDAWDASTAWAGNLADGECGLSDHSAAGNWRLPTKEEWDGIMKPSCPYPMLPDKSGLGCFGTGTQWATGPQVWFYWSSSEVDVERAWAAYLGVGVTSNIYKTVSSMAWPVRNGQ
jgi:hypothetical protein